MEGLMMLDMYEKPKYRAEIMPLTIDPTSSLESSRIRGQNNFILTTFVDPVKVTRQPARRISYPPTSQAQTPPAQNPPSPEEERTKRPPNAFILYRKTMQPLITAKRGIISNAKISKILSDMWKSESEEVKLLWRKEADRKKMEHSQKHPGYVYRPRKPESSDKRRRRNKASRPKNQIHNPTLSAHLGQFTINPSGAEKGYDHAQSPPSEIFCSNHSALHWAQSDRDDTIETLFGLDSAGNDDSAGILDGEYILHPEPTTEGFGSNFTTCVEGFFPHDGSGYYTFTIEDLAGATAKSSRVQSLYDAEQ